MAKFGDFSWGWDDEAPRRTPNQNAASNLGGFSDAANPQADPWSLPETKVATATPDANWSGAPGADDWRTLNGGQSALDQFAGGDLAGQVSAVQNATDETDRVMQRNTLGRNLFSSLKQQGHDVKWQGEQLVVDGLPYELAGGGGGGGGIQSDTDSQAVTTDDGIPVEPGDQTDVFSPDNRPPGGNPTPGVPTTPGADPYQWVIDAYGTFLGRRPSEQEKVAWGSGPYNQWVGAGHIADSPEAKTYTKQKNTPAALGGFSDAANPQADPWSLPGNVRWATATPDANWSGAPGADDWRTLNGGQSALDQFAGGDLAGQVSAVQNATTPYAYQGGWGGFENARLAGGADDLTKTDAKYYFTTIASKFDPYKVHNDPKVQQALLAELNKNTNGFTYALSPEGDFTYSSATEAADGSYMGGRPVGGWGANGGDPEAASNAANWQFQWLPEQSGQAGGGVTPSYNAVVSGTPGAPGAAGATMNSSAAGYADNGGPKDEPAWKPGQGTAVTTAADKAILDYFANPESMGAHTVDTLKAQQKDTLAEMAAGEDENAKAWAFANGLDDSRWFASEKNAANRERDRAMAQSNQAIDIKAAITNTADRVKAATVGVQSEVQATDADRAKADYVLGLMADATKRYGIDVGAQIDREKLAEMGSEFMNELIYKYAGLAQQGNQFNLGYGLDVFNAGENATNNAWNRYTWMNTPRGTS